MLEWYINQVIKTWAAFPNRIFSDISTELLWIVISFVRFILCRVLGKNVY